MAIQNVFIAQYFVYRYIYYFFFVFCLFRATPVANGGSQTRGLIRAVTASLHQAVAMPDPSPTCDLHHSPQQCQILNPLSESRDLTHNLMVPSQICFCCTMTGTPQYFKWEKKDIKSQISLWVVRIYMIVLNHFHHTPLCFSNAQKNLLIL